MLTEQDKDMIVYFIQERGDIERWTGWEDVKEQAYEEYPDLLFALNRTKLAEKLLNAAVKRIRDEM